MAQHVEPMDIDSSVCDFDDKENAFHHNNALPRSRTPCTEKGYEEMDVSELNMKLRYSVTPAASPMSRSYTGNCFDNKTYECDYTLDVGNANMTRSLQTTLTKNDTVIKPQKTLPLQTLMTDHGHENRNVLQPLDSTVAEGNDITVTVSEPNFNDENISVPSSLSSVTHTPEATTPTKEIPKRDGASPIMRGLKSVLNMFRASQSPIPGEGGTSGLETLSPPIVHSPNTSDNDPGPASTPLAGHKTKDILIKRNSTNRDCLVFNEDLEKDLEWKDDSSILFSNEKIPIHKLFFQQPKSSDHKTALNLTKVVTKEQNKENQVENLDATVEYMDISNGSVVMDKTTSKIISDLNKSEIAYTESDSEFLDCETTFTGNESFKSQDNELDSTEDVLSYINDLVKSKSPNASTDTLNATYKSSNMSNASIETAKPDESSVSDAIVSRDCNNITSTTATENRIEDWTKPDKLDILESKETLPVIITANENIKVVNPPVLENNGVQSLFQIPLIVDPRVLLFNIPSVSESEKTNKVLIDEDNFNTSPADIPLPEDEIPSLPIINYELENLSETIGKICYECPEYNQLMATEQSVMDTKLMDSNTADKENSMSEILKAKDYKNSNSQIIIGHKEKEQTSEQIETKVLDNPDLDDTISIANQIGSINLPVSTSDNIKTPSVATSTHIKDENMVFPTGHFEDINIPTYSEIKSEAYIVPTSILFEKDTVRQGMLTSNSIDNQEVPDVNNIPAPNNILAQNVETMDISMSDVPVTNDIKKIEVTVDEVISENSPILELGVPLDSTQIVDVVGVINEDGDATDNFHKIKVEIKEDKEEVPTVNHCVTFDSRQMFQDRKNVECASKQADAYTIESNVEFIKQEVEAIVAQAISIAIEKSNVHIKETEDSVSEVIDDRINSDLLNEKTTRNEKHNTALELGQDQTAQKDIENYFLKELDTTIDLNGTKFIHCEKQACEQQELLNQLSDNKYNYTVQDNIPLPTEPLEDFLIQNRTIITADTAHETTNLIISQSAVAELEDVICKVDTQAIINSKSTEGIKNIASTEDVSLTNDVVTNPEEQTMLVKEGDKTVKEDKLIEATPLDIERKASDAIGDEDIMISGNNSPFVLIPHDIYDTDKTKPIQNLEDADNTFASKIITKTPPTSPKIVSKGYNFNFDEIDDPFATKTKISPATEASPHQMFDPRNLEQEPLKRQFNKSNRRNSQPARKITDSRKFNSTYAGKSSCENSSETEFVLQPDMKDYGERTQKTEHKLSIDCHEFSKSLISRDNVLESLPNKPTAETKTGPTQNITNVSMNEEHLPESVLVFSIDNKGTSSSEQSTYFSAPGTSSDEAIEAEAVKKTDLDDLNFNPFESKSKVQVTPPPENARNSFATRSRICHTPPPNISGDNLFAPISKTMSSPETSYVVSKNTNIHAFSQPPMDKKENNIKIPHAEITENVEKTPTSVIESSIMSIDQLEKKESLEDISGTTCSSNNDKDSTVLEVNTEDEDTIEGPFLEADDLQTDLNLSNVDGESVDMMQFSKYTPRKKKNAEPGELFIDAEAFEFLLNQNQANTVSDCGRESLFLKFDPLFAKRVSSDGVMAALKQIQNQVKQSTPKKEKNVPVQDSATLTKSKEDINVHIQRDATFDQSTLLPGPSGSNATHEMDFNMTAEESYEDFNVTVSKPMMVVNPAVNPIVTPRNKTITPVRSNRHSLTFTSPAIAVIDRLLSMNSGNNSLLSHDTTVAEVHMANEADLALTQLRELLADKEISVYHLKSETKELQGRLATLESQMKGLETISEERLKKIKELNEKLEEKTKMNKSMAQVVEEYERTIASLIDETEQDKKRHAEEKLQLIKERDEQAAHLASMEVSFSDLHSKYEKSKQIILGFKVNEDAYKKSIKEFEENLAKLKKNYELLKQHATSKLNYANEELQKINRAHEAEVLKMNALIKRKELHITSLEETLQQKTKANEELTAICDELINKVG